MEVLEKTDWPAALRVCSDREPFPPCEARTSWPANYPVGELADLNDEEAAETDPACFVYSDPEFDGWRGIVTVLLDELEGPPSWWFVRRRSRSKAGRWTCGSR